MPSENLAKEEGLAEPETELTIDELIRRAYGALYEVTQHGTEKYYEPEVLHKFIKGSFENALPYLQKLAEKYPDNTLEINKELEYLVDGTKQYLKAFDMQFYQNFTRRADKILGLLERLHSDRKKQA